MTLTTENSGPIVRGTVLLQVVTQPTDVEVEDGDTVTLVAWADGRPVPSVQWQQSVDSGDTWDDLADGAGVSGATASELSLGPVAEESDGFQYRAVLTNIVNSVTSGVATLTVVPMSISEGGTGTSTIDVVKV